MKANTGYIATAYTAVAFTPGGGWLSAPTNANWLNNLQNNGGGLSTSKFYNTENTYSSIYSQDHYGPTFGCGHALYIDSGMRNGYTNPCTYTGYSQSTLFGNYNSWQLIDIEVYQT